MAPLEKQVVGIDFVAGLDTRTDERLVVPGKLLAANNVTLSESGALSRRDGWETLATAPAASGLATFNNELLVVNGSTLYSMAQGNGTLYARGKVSPLTLAKQSIRRDGNFQAEPDCATSGEFTCYVWTDWSSDNTVYSGNGVYAMVLDEVTGAVVMGRTQVSNSSTAAGPRVVYVPHVAGANDAACFLVAWEDGAASAMATIDLGNFTVSGSVNFASTAMIDMCAGDGYAYLLYSSNDATNSVFVARIYYDILAGPTVAATTAVATQAAVPVAAIMAFAIAPFSAAHRVGTYILGKTGGTGAGAWGGVYNPSSDSMAVATANLDTTAPNATGGSRITATAVGVYMDIFYDQAGYYGTVALPGGVKPIRTVRVNVSNTIQSGPTTIAYSNATVAPFVNGPFIAAKAFTAGGSSYLPVFIGGQLSATQSQWMLMNASGTIVARALDTTYAYVNSAFTSVVRRQNAPSTPTANGYVIVPANELGLLSFADSVQVSLPGLSRLLLTFFGSVPPVRAMVAGNTFFAGGILTAYDGRAVTEAGFLSYPEGVSVVDGAAGAIPAGTYQYVALYEWLDGQGQRHQSAPSVAKTYVAPGSKKATVTVPTLLLTQKNGVTVVVYRTTLANTGTFYRLTSVNVPIQNSTSAASIVFTDNALDATLTGELLYTTGDVLPNDAPPSCSVLAVHQNRLFIGGLENPGELRYSQPAVDGFGLQWNETLAGLVDANGGGISALASMDDKLIIFCLRRPYFVSGFGPTTTGTQNGYSSPEEITSDVGCVEPRSVLKMPMGLLFKATKGWHLLDRALQVKYVGAGVDAYDANSVCAAVLLDDRKECRFYGLGGTTLIYSYLVDQWETSSGFAAVDAVWWPTAGAVVWATAAGAVRGDTPGEYSDGGAAIVASFDTGWLKPGNALHGFERVYRLLLEGPYGSSGSLTITAFYDYSLSQADTVTFPVGGFYYSSNFENEAAVTFNPTSALASPDGASWGLRWLLPRQKCEAIRFRIVETPSGGTLAGLGFSSMSLEMGLKRGAYKLKAAQSG